MQCVILTYILLLELNSSVRESLCNFLTFLLNLGLEIGGEMNLAAGIQVAQLALKHRQNKKQQQRIIVFTGRYEQLFFSVLF